MRILIIRNFPSYMAVKNNTYNIQEVGLAKALVRKGNVCDILFWTNKEEETVTLPVGEYGQVHVFYRRGITKIKNTVYTGCTRLYKQYDILQPCEYNQIQSWILAKTQPGKTVIYHGPYFSSFNKRYNLMCKIFDALFLKRYIKQETVFLVKSQMAKEFLVTKGIDSDHVQVVGVGIDAEMLSSGKSACKENLYFRMKEDKENLKILYVGRLEERRNIPFLFEIFAEVIKTEKDARLYLIGTGDKKYVKFVFEYADQLGIKDKIIWQERMEQKYLSHIYTLADFFLLPTEYEIFGMVLLEAMYYKTVVLTTRNGGSSTLIEHGRNGFILENRNARKWASCIVKVYENSSRMRSIQKRAFIKIAEEYTWDALADCFMKQYQLRMEKRG